MRFGAKLFFIVFLIGNAGLLGAQEAAPKNYAESIKFIWREKSNIAEVDKLFDDWKKSLTADAVNRLAFDDLAVQWLLRKESWTIEAAGMGAGLFFLRQSMELYPAAGLYPSAQIIRNLCEANAQAVCDALAAGAKNSYAKGNWYEIKDKYIKIEEISFNIHSENWYGYKARAEEIFRAFREYERYVQTNDDFWLNATVFGAGLLFDAMFIGITMEDPVNDILDQANQLYAQYDNPLSADEIAELEDRVFILYSQANSMEVIHWLSGILGVGMTITGSYLLLDESEGNREYLKVKLKPFFE